jgi:hypothetical protein
MFDMPFFMSNPKWFWFDADKKRFVLTDDAPQKAQDSYSAFYEAVEEKYGK